MRFALIVAAIALAIAGACSTKQGAYLVVDGSALGAKFDRVELFVGTNAGSGIPQTPATLAAQMPAPLPGKRFERVVADTDNHVMSAPAKTLDYFIPAGATLGGYVGVVAYAGDQPIGVGEVFAPGIPTDTLYEYRVALESIAPGELELWGTGTAPGCFRWSHARGTGRPATVAVVRTGDHDCDDVPAHLDCADLSYCAPGDTTCSTVKSMPCFTSSTNACGIGACVDGVGCTPDTCLVPGACDSACSQIDDPQMRLDCALAQSFGHGDYALPVTDGQVLQCDPFLFGFALPTPSLSTPFVCTNPVIESPANGIVDGFQYVVTEDPTGPDCIVSVSAVTPGTSLGSTDRHLLISIDAAQPPFATFTRTTLVIGTIAGSNAPVDCSIIPELVPVNANTGGGTGLATCGP